jgi:RimJ/RimL family protein N-acetyltransferase
LPETEAIMRSLLLPWKFHLPFGRQTVRDTWRLRDGTAVTLRAARANDGELIQQLVRGLSLESRYQRFFYPVHELTPDMLARFTHNASAEAITLLAVVRQHGRETAIAMAQYVADRYPDSCDFAVVVADEWQRFGLGERLVRTLVCIARAAGIARIEGDILAENEGMKRLMLKLGFRVTHHADGAYLRKVWKALDAAEWECSRTTVLVEKARAGTVRLFSAL